MKWISVIIFAILVLFSLNFVEGTLYYPTSVVTHNVTSTMSSGYSGGLKEGLSFKTNKDIRILGFQMISDLASNCYVISFDNQSVLATGTCSDLNCSVNWNATAGQHLIVAYAQPQQAHTIWENHTGGWFANRTALNFTYAGVSADFTGTWYRQNITGVSNITIKESMAENNFTLCDNPYDIPLMTFTFQNEDNSSAMSGVLDLFEVNYIVGSDSENYYYEYSNYEQKDSFSFCSVPYTTNISASFTIRYSALGYPQRIWGHSGIYTNSTTNHTLLLLSSSDGIYSSIITTNNYANPIQNVSIKVEREISGEWITLGQSSTDSSGSATFWLNPDYEHRITAVKSGYSTRIETIRPTSSSYTLMMSQEGVSQNYSFKGISWEVGPRNNDILSPNKEYIFYFNVTSSENNLANCKMELRNITRDIIASNTSVGSGTKCYAYINLAVGNYDKLYGYLYLDLGEGYGLLKANDPWMFENTTLVGRTNYHLWDALKDFNDLPEFGDTHNRQEFSKIVAFFFIITLLIAGFTFTTGYDFAQPGVALLLLWGLVLAGSFAGIFEIRGLSPLVWFDKYLIALTCTFLTWGYLFGQWRKTA